MDKEKIKINPWFVHALLSPLAGYADIDVDGVDEYRNVDPNNEMAIKKIIRDVFLPFYKNRNTLEFCEQMKNSLKFYLSTNLFDWERKFNSCLLPFDHPDNPRDFFVWIWEEWHPDERYQISNVSDYSVNDDINELQMY
jgi:hypothetical protein